MILSRLYALNYGKPSERSRLRPRLACAVLLVLAPLGWVYLHEAGPDTTFYSEPLLLSGFNFTSTPLFTPALPPNRQPGWKHFFTPTSNFSSKAPLEVEAATGLTGRLRVLVSYLAVARSERRQLIVHWVPDEQCPSSFHALFEPIGSDVSVVEAKGHASPEYTTHPDYRQAWRRARRTSCRNGYAAYSTSACSSCTHRYTAGAPWRFGYLFGCSYSANGHGPYHGYDFWWLPDIFGLVPRRLLGRLQSCLCRCRPPAVPQHVARRSWS